MSNTPVHISTMSGKLEGFKSISTNTLTNKFCVKMHTAKKATICKVCYSHQMLSTYRKNTATALQRNSALLSTRHIEAWELPTIKDKHFRFNAHGELINLRHYQNLMNITRHNPDTTFTLWTKRKDIVKECHTVVPPPSNLILVYSNPEVGKIMEAPPPYFDKTFNNVLEGQDVERQNCTGQKCKDCLLCYTHGTTDTIVEKVKKYD
jgi:hypothetical protein